MSQAYPEAIDDAKIVERVRQQAYELAEEIIDNLPDDMFRPMRLNAITAQAVGTAIGRVQAQIGLDSHHYYSGTTAPNPVDEEDYSRDEKYYDDRSDYESDLEYGPEIVDTIASPEPESLAKAEKYVDDLPDYESDDSVIFVGARTVTPPAPMADEYVDDLPDYVSDVEGIGYDAVQVKREEYWGADGGIDDLPDYESDPETSPVTANAPTIENAGVVGTTSKHKESPYVGPGYLSSLPPSKGKSGGVVNKGKNSPGPSPEGGSSSSSSRKRKADDSDDSMTRAGKRRMDASASPPSDRYSGSRYLY
ncbi:hypothetical protein F4677DRAFT_5150 [Hypoxylon crocopeplum]|nr:hypothetical protein F4677DRAFT_5150 [Hypoxylon crocopeplum]